MYLIYNILLAAVWVGLTGDLSIGNIIFALLLSFLLIAFTQRVLDIPMPKREPKSYVTRVRQTIYFGLFFLMELMLASLKILASVLSPLDRLQPGVIAVPIDLETEFEITLLSNLITLTPGTLTLDVSTDRRVIYVHAFFVDDPESFRQSIKNGFEKRVMEVMR